MDEPAHQSHRMKAFVMSHTNSNSFEHSGLQHKRLGNNVVILEQETGERSGQEAGIGFGDAVNDFYNKYDATGVAAAIHNRARRFAYRTHPDVFRNNKPLSLTSWGLIYRLLRANFDGMASPACPNPPPPLPGDGIASYLSGKRVSAFETTPGKVTVRYVDVQTNEEKSLSADLLIGADGIHSTIRRLVKAPTLERYAGYVSWRGTVPERELSKETCEYFSDWLCLNLAKRSYLIGYVQGALPSTIPPPESQSQNSATDRDLITQCCLDTLYLLMTETSSSENGWSTLYGTTTWVIPLQR